MSLALPSQLIANTSLLNIAQLSSFPPPEPPDIDFCDGFFSNPLKPQVDDCISAFNLLPAGNTPVRYRPWRMSTSEPKGLLVCYAVG